MQSVCWLSYLYRGVGNGWKYFLVGKYDPAPVKVKILFGKSHAVDLLIKSQALLYSSSSAIQAITPQSPSHSSCTARKLWNPYQLTGTKKWIGACRVEQPLVVSLSGHICSPGAYFPPDTSCFDVLFPPTPSRPFWYAASLTSLGRAEIPVFDECNNSNSNFFIPLRCHSDWGICDAMHLLNRGFRGAR